MDSLTAQLIEVGAIGIFAFYALANNREWRKHLTERNSKLEKILDRIHNKLD